MKYMIASDIHGSAKYCRLLLAAWEREKPDKLVLLGDLLYHGPRNPLPEEYDTFAVFAMLNEHKNELLCVRGNCDAEVDQMVLDFPMMADYAMLDLKTRHVFVTHGHLFSMDQPPKLQKGDWLLHGHTHVPAWTPFGDENVYLNPGSVSIPKDGTPHGYMLLDDDRVLWKTLDGTVYHEL